MIPIDLEGLRALLAGKRHDAYVEVFAPQLRALIAELTALRSRDAGWSLQSEEQAEEIARLRAALQPFAKFADRFGDTARDDSWNLTRNPSGKGDLTMGDVRAASTALRSAAQPAAERWQPIETVPKDGREILMAYGDFDGSPPLVVAWSDEVRGWLAVGAEVEVLTKPTHWMPLPAPPAAAAERAPHGEDGGAS